MERITDNCSETPVSNNGSDALEKLIHLTAKVLEQPIETIRKSLEDVGKYQTLPYYRKEQQVTFLFDKICSILREKKSLNSLKEMINFLEEISKDSVNQFANSLWTYKGIYNSKIGWALPTETAINFIYQSWQRHLAKYPTARLIDRGAGTGIYSLLLAERGISKDSLIALEVPYPPKNSEFDNFSDDCSNDDQPEIFPTKVEERFSFYPLTIVEPGTFEYRKEDFILICWGHPSNDFRDVRKYLNEGGTCLVIQGEMNGGCTIAVDFLYENPDELKSYNGWELTDKVKVSSLASSYGEWIYYNTRYD